MPNTPRPPQRGNPEAVALGPGVLWYALQDRPFPMDLDSEWTDADPSWIHLGYTVAGSEFNWALDTSEVEVAEELDPILLSTTGRTGSVAFAMAEMTASHMSVALNGGIITDDPANGVVIIEPPGLGLERRCMLGFDSEDGTERWVFKKCFQNGTMKVTREKGTTIAAMEVSFALEKPNDGSASWIAIMDRALRGGWLVNPGPRITGITPPAAAAAATVAIAGTGLTGATAAGITFGGAPCATIGAVTDTSIAGVVVPAGAPGAANVVVTAGGMSSAAFPFTRN